MEKKTQRRHTAAFRTEIVEKMVSGINVTALAKLHKLPRSMMYRWREAYRNQGPAGLEGVQGRPPKKTSSVRKTAPRQPVSVEERLRERIAELERKVGQQAVEIDFFRGVFKRLEELPKAKRRGGAASTPRS